MKKAYFSLVMVTLLALTACASPAGISPTQPSFSDQVATVVAATLATFPSKTPEPSPEPTAGASCPEPTEATRLLTREAMGYCLLYPEGFIEVDTEPMQVCLVPDAPTMLCHNATIFINVEAANGRTSDQVADALIAQGGFNGQRYSLTVAGEEAVMLEPLYGQATSRVVFVAHADRLYTLSFIGPWDQEGSPELEQSKRLYDTIINSFGFLPISTQPTATPRTPSPSPTSVSCPNALPTRLQVGGYAYVSLDPPLSNRVRNGPAPNYQVIGDIEPGEAMKILSGPTCAQDRLWWEIQALKGGLTGWTAEGDSKDYWLVPCASPTGCGVP